MKIGIRNYSLSKRISSRTSVKRYIRHNMGIKMPKGTGIITNPRKAIYNKIYNKTTISFEQAIACCGGIAIIVIFFIMVFMFL